MSAFACVGNSTGFAQWAQSSSAGFGRSIVFCNSTVVTATFAHSPTCCPWDGKALLSDSCSPWMSWIVVYFRELMIMATSATGLWMGSCLCSPQFPPTLPLAGLIHSCWEHARRYAVFFFQARETIRSTVMQFLARGETEAFITLGPLYLGATSSARPCHLRTKRAVL